MNRTIKAAAWIAAAFFWGWFIASVVNVDAQNMTAGDTTAWWNFFRLIF